MLGGAMLPEGIQSAVVPSKVVQNYVETGVDALAAVSQAAGESWSTGQLELAPLDDFGRRIDARPGADPFAGWSQAFGLAAEDLYRDDGGSVVSDLDRITRDDWAEASMTGAEQFQQAAAQGEYKSVLRGLNDVFDVTSQVVYEPGATLGGFVDDCSTILQHGVGDGFWSDVAKQTDQTLKDTPIVDKIYTGYQEIFGGIAQHAEGTGVVERATSGVSGFATEMYEGASALAGEASEAVTSRATTAGEAVGQAAADAYQVGVETGEELAARADEAMAGAADAIDAVAASAGPAYDYLRSWF
jgi:hypothetical protein